jgi:hypothetical protein
MPRKLPSWTLYPRLCSAVRNIPQQFMGLRALQFKTDLKD